MLPAQKLVNAKVSVDLMVKLFIEIFKHSTIFTTLIEHLGVTHSSKTLHTSFLILTLSS